MPEGAARTPLHVLVAEDSEDDATLLVRELRRNGYDPTWERVEDPESMRAALSRSTWDIVMSDSSMPHFGARAALDILKQTGLDIPFVIVSGTIGEEAAVEAMRAGAGDFILKDKLARLAPVVDRELRESKMRAASRRTEEERARLEEQLRQSQKMEAVGRLAGGVAHDFNNVLSVILSYGEMIIGDLKPGDPIRADVEEVRKAARRAADLTRQLLMFSRQQVIEPKVLDLNEVLTSMDKMLQRILGADVDLVSVPAKGLGRVRVDPSGVEQVILNLVVNARDAMPTGGQLTMETANVVLDQQYARDHLGVKPGPHVMLAVTDTGVGMDRVTQARIFEPFFTTKDKGKGTGLGLSTVFGIVQQSGGSIWVYSELGKGTTFKVYLPEVDAAVDVSQSSTGQRMLRGSETILLVEDDEQVRVVARGILQRSGYRVIDAGNAAEALLHSEQHSGPIHLLLSDVVMPQMSGPDLAKRLATARPDMKVLCMSGYTDDTIVRHGVLGSQVMYLQKPITPESLTLKVREVLDEHNEGTRLPGSTKRNAVGGDVLPLSGEPFRTQVHFTEGRTRVRILVIDDDVKVQSVVKRAAEAAGFEVIQAFDGTPGLTLATAERFDLILLDINMPAMDGRDVLRRLKENSTTTDIPVLVYSGRNSQHDRVVALELGAADHVDKPFARLPHWDRRGPKPEGPVTRWTAVLRACHSSAASLGRRRFLGFRCPSHPRTHAFRSPVLMQPTQRG